MQLRRAVRRSIAGAAVAVVAAWGTAAVPASAPAGARHAAAATPPRPNFVVFMLDDLDALVMPYWDALPKTKAWLKGNGLFFSNSFSTSPVSAPGRAAVLSGKYGHNSNVITNHGPRGGYPAFRDAGNEQRTFAKYLQDAGYRTMLAGKYLPLYIDEPSVVPPGWTEWYGGGSVAIYFGYDYLMNENGTIVQYGHAPSDYLTDVITRKGTDFIDRAEANDAQPFLAYLAPTGPHIPLPPAPRHESHPWATTRTPQRANFYEENLADKPNWLQVSTATRDMWRAELDGDYQDRMGSLLSIDDMVFNIIVKLYERGELGNTYFIFTSDNGYNFGAHHMFGKMAAYEESSQIPLLIAGPNVRRGTDKHMVIQPDVLPTILELAGVAVPSDVDGRSLAPLLHGEDPQDWRDSFLLQYEVDIGPFDHGDPRETAIYWNMPSYRALRTTRYTYVEHWNEADFGGTHEYELYDLLADPFQMNNLLGTEQGRQQWRALQSLLRFQLERLGSCSGSTCRVPPATPGAGSNPVTIPIGGISPPSGSGAQAAPLNVPVDD